ncbi:hypothetical protein A3A93_05370 [Candidatus Roizmanbacteria bacterium RIFCSPLOWO2_01_FULL_38_12]|uniref:DUF2207 domain-containing protein n=1 Tax=Candidatus Roizmanbacteria bacterium RIFCSPLOWO2_01_FULL_38_12 TaxID=1802061 RepID=A0A1F7IZ31_9BACT|nr:MAG: hypothetical protein A2861_03585 [Candidatus Roizmanbacteria bacterium RIFCSPHIGHO2_01_FULL_38_15]OGK35652.1 MAG: hypothetical protein A3F59_01800 [Candidatus Roizmanbacteria bacterium RIFCSPHIGHO2_12_FULL_38_13]OGK48618.1 MAG: hypothetical protein A3A93_05370 [Candidatus Roizmanbacteria bacterium RIFCSPLOWO2_01_FULL_38_12]
MRKIISVFFASIFFFLLATPTIAQSNLPIEQIHDYVVSIEIQKDGNIQLAEKIVYDFGNLQRHGIIRKIPFIKINKEGKRFRMNIDVISVSDELGNNYNYKTTNLVDREIEIKVGDADKTITGVHTYVITYTVSGAITYFSDHDELYWNVTGNEWDVPMESSSAVISLPSENKSALMTNTICYTGHSGSTLQDCTKEVNGNTVTFKTDRDLNRGEGLTVVVGFPKNIVAVLEPREVINFFDTPFGKFVAALIIIIAAIVGIFWYILYPIWLPLKWYMHGRDPSGMIGEARSWFDPPKTKDGRMLTPAETGTLIDEIAGPHEISALIIDLARRGYMKIVEKKKNDFEFVKMREFATDSTLQEFEKIFLTELFTTKKTVRLKDTKLYGVVTTIQDLIYENLVKEGFFPQNPDKVRKYYFIIAGLAAFTLNFFLLIVSAIFGRIMPKKTLEGVGAANITRSLKNFLVSQERQLEFQAKNQMFFEKLLPYAVAFGVEKIWAQRFEDIDMKQPDWYEGTTHGAFNSVVFTNSLRSSFNSFTTAATPTTSSSGFSSGFSGGSSGGGGGGGGGGSW